MHIKGTHFEDAKHSPLDQYSLYHKRVWNKNHPNKLNIIPDREIQEENNLNLPLRRHMPEQCACVQKSAIRPQSMHPTISCKTHHQHDTTHIETNEILFANL